MRKVEERPRRSQAGTRLWGLLFVLSGNMLIDALEVSVVIVALPSIGGSLGLSLGEVQWVMSGFAIGFGGLLLLGGRVISLLGRRKVYLAALLVFAAASVAGGLVSEAVLVVAARFVKGVCVALTAPTGLAIIGATFREGPARNRAISIYSLFGAAGFTVGLILSGLLTQVDWRWTLAFPAPAALVLFMFGWWLIPRDEPAERTAQPLVRFDVLRKVSLLRSSLCAASLNGSFWGFLFVCTFQLQLGAGWTPLQTALALLPASLLLMATALLSPRLVGRFGTGRLIVLGLAAPAIGYLLYLRQDEPATYVIDVLPSVVLVGLGFVFAFSALHVQATAGVPEQALAMTSGLYQTSVQLGGALVLLVTAALSAPGFRSALLLVAAVAGLGFLVALTGALRRPESSHT
jgi:predicted MFS family arabinose efflux permease